MGVASVASHPGPTPRGFRACLCGPIPYSPSVRRAQPPFPCGPGQVPPGAPAPSTGPIDVSKMLEGITFDMNSTDWEARETFAAILRRLGGSVTNGAGGTVFWGGHSGGGGGSAVDVSDLELPDDASQRTVRETLQRLLDRIRAASACVLAALSLTAFSGQWQDVSPTQTVASAVADALNPLAGTNGVNFTCQKTNALGVACGDVQNGAIELGVGAKAATPAATIARLGTNTAFRSVSVAIGEHADAAVDAATGQAIAIGFCAQAKANNAVAIGSGTQHTFETAETGDATVASAGEAMAFGYGAKATAQRAVQLGAGVNAEANTLKFRDTVVVRNGRVVGSLDTNAVTAAVYDAVRPAVAETDGEVEARPLAVTSIAFTNEILGAEIEVVPAGPRNYELFVPNTPQMRASLPMTLGLDIPEYSPTNTTRLGPWDERIMKLPVKARIVEPLPRTLILEYTYYDDGRVWSPTSFYAYVTNGDVRVEGECLHYAAQYAIGLHAGGATNGTAYVPGTTYMTFPLPGTPLYPRVTIPTNDIPASYVAAVDHVENYPFPAWFQLYLYDADGNEIVHTQITRYRGVNWRWAYGPGDPVEVPYYISEPTFDEEEVDWVAPPELPGFYPALMHYFDDDADIILFRNDDDDFVVASRGSTISI